MTNAQLAARSIFYSVWAVLMTALTYILGAASLKLLRRQSGRWIYWGLTVALSAALFAVQFKILAIAYLSLVLLVGVFSELEDLGLSFNVSSFFTLVINGLVGAGAFAIWVSSTGPKWSATVLAAVESALKPVVDYNPNLQINYYELMLQLPSVILIAWMGAIYLAVLLETRTGRDEAVVEAPAMRRQLFEFRMPDPGVWIFIAALLGAFSGLANKPLEAISANVLNVCFVLFFFQGIAVVARFFEKMRLGLIWQILLMVLIVANLFFFVSILGLTDYWFDFRARLAKGTSEFERET